MTSSRTTLRWRAVGSLSTIICMSLEGLINLYEPPTSWRSCLFFSSMSAFVFVSTYERGMELSYEITS